MTVYMVMATGGYEGDFVEAIFKNEKDAEKYAMHKNRFRPDSETRFDYEIVEEDVIESELNPKIDKEKVFIRVRSKAKMTKHSMDTYPHITMITADKYSETKYAISDYFKLFEFAVYVKAEDTDYELSDKELSKKYQYVIDDIRDIVKEHREKDDAFDIITSTIKETLTYLTELVREKD